MTQPKRVTGATAGIEVSPVAPKKNNAKEKHNSIPLDEENLVHAFGSTFVLAPTFSLRIGAEDNLLLHSFARADGPAILLQTELQPRMPTREFHLDIAPSLSSGATRVLTEDNAGGSSYISEAMSVELLHRCFGAALCKTEMELEYWPSNGAITDFSVELAGGIELGVSVTRALQPPKAKPFSEVDAEALLRKKLKGVIRSTETCVNGAWSKQLLHVWAQSAKIAARLRAAYERLEPELVADTLVLVTLCRGMPELFNERAVVERQRLKLLKGRKDERHLAVLRESDPCRSLHRSAAGG